MNSVWWSGGGDFLTGLQGAKCLFFAGLLGEKAAKERDRVRHRHRETDKKKNTHTERNSDFFSIMSLIWFSKPNHNDFIQRFCL